MVFPNGKVTRGIRASVPHLGSRAIGPGGIQDNLSVHSTLISDLKKANIQAFYWINFLRKLPQLSKVYLPKFTATFTLTGGTFSEARSPTLSSMTQHVPQTLATNEAKGERVGTRKTEGTLFFAGDVIIHLKNNSRQSAGERLELLRVK